MRYDPPVFYLPMFLSMKKVEKQVEPNNFYVPLVCYVSWEIFEFITTLLLHISPETTKSLYDSPEFVLLKLMHGFRDFRFNLFLYAVGLYQKSKQSYTHRGVNFIPQNFYLFLWRFYTLHMTSTSEFGFYLIIEVVNFGGWFSLLAHDFERLLIKSH